jgi:hypothetical protein
MNGELMPMPVTPELDRPRRFDRGAWLTLVFALALILASAAQLAYRFILPTDGWIVPTVRMIPKNLSLNV